MGLVDANWRNPLHGLVNGHPKAAEQKNPLRTAYVRFSRELNYLSLIWERLVPEVEAHDTYWQWWNERYIFHRVTTPDFAPEAEVKLEQYQKATRFLWLDIEDFLLRADMLLDRLAYLVGILLGQTISENRREDDEWKNFSSHRQFFIKKPFPRDEAYAKFIKDETEWFDDLGKFRNQFITHDITSEISGSSVQLASTPRLLRQYRKSDELMVSYSPDLNELTKGILSYFSFLSEHFS